MINPILLESVILKKLAPERNVDNKRFFTILKNMLESGEYKESVFEDILDDIGVPSVYMAILDEAKADDPIHPWMQLYYIESIRKGVFEPNMGKDQIVRCVQRVLEFRYEFYRRSPNKTEDVLSEYHWCAQEAYLKTCFEGTSDIDMLPFEFEPSLTLQHNLHLLREFTKNAEAVLRNFHSADEKAGSLIPLDLLDFGVKKAERSQDEEDPLFKRWERYLRVFDLLEQEWKQNRRSPVVYEEVGKQIQAEFQKYLYYTADDLRANIKKDYKHATYLILAAEKGTFPKLKKEVQVVSYL